MHVPDLLRLLFGSGLGQGHARLKPVSQVRIRSPRPRRLSPVSFSLSAISLWVPVSGSNGLPGSLVVASMFDVSCHNASPSEVRIYHMSNVSWNNEVRVLTSVCSCDAFERKVLST